MSEIENLAEVPSVQVEIWPVTRLVAYERNAKKHPPAQVAQLRASIEEFGFTNPILVSSDGTIRAGHGRGMAVEEMMRAGIPVRLPDGRALPVGHVPVIVLDGMTDEQLRAYTIADNKLTENGGWDEDLLKLELEDLRLEEFDIGLTGFDTKELDKLLGMDLSGGDPQDEPPEETGVDSDKVYTRKIEAPIYQPSGEQPAIADIYDRAKTDALIEEIEGAGLPEDVAAFLKAAAGRHTVFHFRRIADYYASAPAEVQRLMERSALVIIDFNKAIEEGFVRLSKRLGDLVARDYPDGDGGDEIEGA